MNRGGESRRGLANSAKLVPCPMMIERTGLRLTGCFLATWPTCGTPACMRYLPPRYLDHLSSLCVIQNGPAHQLDRFLGSVTRSAFLLIASRQAFRSAHRLFGPSSILSSAAARITMPTSPAGSRSATDAKPTGAAMRTQSTLWEVANLNPFDRAQKWVVD